MGNELLFGTCNMCVLEDVWWKKISKHIIHKLKRMKI